MIQPVKCQMASNIKTILHVAFLMIFQIVHGNAVAEHGFSVNTAFLSKDRVLLDETIVQALRLVKETI